MLRFAGGCFSQNIEDSFQIANLIVDSDIRDRKKASFAFECGVFIKLRNGKGGINYYATGIIFAIGYQED